VPSPSCCATPRCARSSRRSCRLLLVDEFQDLSPAFLLLVRLLAAPAGQVFAVGDDDQTIYGYRNADPAHLVHFEHWFPEPTAYALHTNYRCPADVVTAAGNLLSRNTVRVPKSTVPAHDAPEQGMTIQQVEGDELAAHAVDWVQGHRDEAAALGDIAVLARVHAMLLPVQIGLVVAGIPAHSQVGADLLDRTGARAALAWLRLAAGPPDRLVGTDVAEAIRRSPQRIRSETLRALAARPRWTRAALRNHAFTVLSVWEGKELRSWIDDLDEVRDEARYGGTVAALSVVRDLLDEALDALDTSTTASKQTSSHSDDITALIQVAGLQPDAARFEPWLRELLAGGADRGGGDAVTLATIHATKGLEWPHVLVYAANAGLMPHRLATGSVALEEERRVFHVALTRTSRDVVVLADADAPSPFLTELTAPQPPPTAASPSRRSTGQPPRRRATQPRLPTRLSDAEQPRVAPSIGAAVETAGGIRGAVEDIDEQGVLIRTKGGALLRARYGERITQAGTEGVLRPAAPDAGRGSTDTGR
jgi:DNA helicase II / ATP-dependent DNA helicase PcrA